MNVSVRTKIRRRLSKLKQEARIARLALSGNPAYSCRVNLENVLIGEQCGTPLERWVEKTAEWDRASRLLKDSPYVHFLQAVSKDESLIDDDDFLESLPYYRMAQIAVKFTGGYFGSTEPPTIKRQMRGFYEMFASIRDGRQNTSRFDDYRHSTEGDPVMMSKIRDSDCYELSDGHHRAAVFYVLGPRNIEARIVGRKNTYLQRLARQSAAESRLELGQPVDTADVRNWTVRRKCGDRLQLILEFLRRRGWAHSIRTVLDAPCGYGWFVDRLRRQGMNVSGVTPADEHVKIGRIAYGLPDDVLRRQETADALGQTETIYDMVLFLSALHHYELGEKSEDSAQILRLIDRVTGRVLILDSGHGGESWFQTGLPDWNDDQIQASILRHTTFTEVIPLGKDGDGRGHFKNQFGRTLFACIR